LADSLQEFKGCLSRLVKDL